MQRLPKARVTTMMQSQHRASSLDIRLFGSFAVCIGGQPLAPLHSRKGRYLLALLTLRVEAGTEVPRRLEVMFSIPSAQSVIAARLRDASEPTGASPEAMSDSHSIKASGRVAHCRPQADGSYVIGVAFSSILPQDQIRLLHFTGEADNHAND